MGFLRKFTRDRLLPAIAAMTVVLFCVLLRNSYRVSQAILRTDKLPVIVSKITDPKIGVGQRSGDGIQKNSSLVSSTRTIDSVIDDILKMETKRAGANAPAGARGDNRAGFRVQLAALKNDQQVANYVDNVRRAHEGLLKNLEVFVEKTGSGGGTELYRVQIGMFSTRDRAIAFCKNFLSGPLGNSSDCIPVR
ncbi:MAG: SPOR domain-containing protein [Rickettsiales bacterium]|jgi:hypothetical protein|nr:SPOR domain-containing protein [Rickettsiales bacterium]